MLFMRVGCRSRLLALVFLVGDPLLEFPDRLLSPSSSLLSTVASSALILDRGVICSGDASRDAGDDALDEAIVVQFATSGSFSSACAFGVLK